ncbi:MAG TPA: metal ABC transporter substrate-binding protein [Thermoanaerobaculaceae bacterium]|nr:metal ABC transporter substrate-binding protein [Thermoanaerobaculaceae bacterium]HRS16264.1 metal ABC transporter substrate-binding protein [Thermoanaerobaculaceae bacterium]
MKAFLSFAMFVTLAVGGGAQPLRVVTSIPDHAALVRVIGGTEVEAESVVTGNRDVHAVELLPSFMVKVSRADVYVKVGLDLDLWAQQIIDGSRNGRLIVVDASAGIEKLGVPAFKVDASYGDLHRFGNPHYWLDPANLRPQGEAILAGLVQARPAAGERFRASLEAYLAKADAALATWQARLAPFSGARVVTFHDSWPYFARRFGIEVVGFLEPKPGVPPTPTHIAALTERLKDGRVKAIVMESYFDDRVPKMLSRTTGVPLVKVPVLVGAVPGVDDPLALFESITAALAQVLGEAR